MKQMIQHSWQHCTVFTICKKKKLKKMVANLQGFSRVIQNSTRLLIGWVFKWSEPRKADTFLLYVEDCFYWDNHEIYKHFPNVILMIFYEVKLWQMTERPSGALILFYKIEL